MGTFRGAKLALFVGEALAVLLRDDRPDIPYPDHWDLPGGGREGGETPLACALRETREELGLIVPGQAVRWGRRFESESEGAVSWFFAAHLPAEAAERIVLGDEGQMWTLMPPRDFVTHPRAVPHFRTRLALYLSGAAGERFERPPAVGGGS